jgi:hypothetical protein
MEIHDSIVNLMETYIAESEKFEKGNKSAGTRARKALAEMAKLAKDRRAEIQTAKADVEKAIEQTASLVKGVKTTLENTRKRTVAPKN